MNRLVAVFSVVAIPAILLAQPSREKIPPRFGIEADIDKYPQATPKDALRSVVKAIDAKRFDYVMAQLVEPAFVDKRVRDPKDSFENKQVKNEKDKFDEIVKEVSRKYENDPETIRQLRKFLSDGEFPDPQGGDTVEVKCPDIKSKHLFLKKVGTRWFLMDRTHPDKAKEREKEKEKEPEKEKGKE